MLPWVIFRNFNHLLLPDVPVTRKCSENRQPDPGKREGAFGKISRGAPTCREGGRLPSKAPSQEWAGIHLASAPEPHHPCPPRRCGLRRCLRPHAKGKRPATCVLSARGKRLALSASAARTGERLCGCPARAKNARTAMHRKGGRPPLPARGKGRVAALLALSTHRVGRCVFLSATAPKPPHPCPPPGAAICSAPSPPAREGKKTCAPCVVSALGKSGCAARPVDPSHREAHFSLRLRAGTAAPPPAPSAAVCDAPPARKEGGGCPLLSAVRTAFLRFFRGTPQRNLPRPVADAPQSKIHRKTVFHYRFPQEIKTRKKQSASKKIGISKSF